MASVKVLNTGLGVTAALVSGYAVSENMDILDYPVKMGSDFNVSYIKKQGMLKVNVREIYRSMIHPLSRDIEVNTKYGNQLSQPVLTSDDFAKAKIDIYQRKQNGEKYHLDVTGAIDVPINGSSIVYFERQSPKTDSDFIRMATLVSGGPDAIALSALAQQAMEEQIEKKDLYYFLTGRPSDQKEMESVYNFSERFGWDVHIIDIEAQKYRLLPCGADEPTFIRYGLASALSLVAAHSELAGGHDVIFLGLHAADSLYKARDSKEYTRKFIDNWNQLWTKFYPKKPLISTPFIDSFDKIDILKIGNALNLSLSETWSCYKGEEHHCGECKSCLERRLAFATAKIKDETIYKTEFKISDSKKKNLMSAISLEAAM